MSNITHWGWDQTAATLQTTFSTDFVLYKWLNLDISLKFVQLTIMLLSFRQSICAKLATRHCLDQWWHRLMRHICVFLPQSGLIVASRQPALHGLDFACTLWNFVSGVNYSNSIMGIYCAHVILTIHIWITKCNQRIVLRTAAVALAEHT